MRFSELEDVRVKLDEQGQRELWNVIDEFGGVKNFSEAFGISSSKMYNWKSKTSFVPVNLVKRVFGNEGSRYVEAYKGPGRSSPVRNPVFPVPENAELLTRIKCSVTVNQNGIPLYQTVDEGLKNRFQELLFEIGDVPIKVYSREVYEVRYPKYLHEILASIEFEEDLNAKIDEIGKINGGIILEGEKIRSEKVDRLYHRGKRMKLALLKQDKKEITKLMSEEKEKVRKALNQA